MPLPKIVTPSYELTLPSNRKKIKYRPFLVKEEKILILAIEGGNMKDITTAIKDVLANCVLTKGVNIEELPTFDIEYLFLNIRSRSVGESIDLIITCPDDGKTKVNSTIYIDEIKVKKPKDHKKDIKIDDTYTMRLKYPTLDQFIESNFSLDKEDDTSKSKHKTFLNKAFNYFNQYAMQINAGSASYKTQNYHTDGRIDENAGFTTYYLNKASFNECFRRETCIT